MEEEETILKGVDYLVNKKQVNNIIDTKRINTKVAILIIKLSNMNNMRIIQAKQFYENITKALEYCRSQCTLLTGDINVTVGQNEDN